ncbi:MAG: hypothetical protein K2N27_02895 [Ruminococcus sp.]|nr:hypothetical protein [Ruminococcus sp.]
MQEKKHHGNHDAQSVKQERFHKNNEYRAVSLMNWLKQGRKYKRISKMSVRSVSRKRRNGMIWSDRQRKTVFLCYFKDAKY